MTMPILRNLVPITSVVVLALVAALPFGLPSDVRFIMPLLPYTVIHYWAVRRPTLMPEWGVFLVGLGTDVLTNGPLGFWSLIFLIGVVAVDATRDLPDWGAVGRWIQFCATLLVLGLAAWLVTSIYFLELADWKPMAVALAMAALSYPLFGLLLRPLHRLLRIEIPALNRPTMQPSSLARQNLARQSTGRPGMTRPNLTRGA
jgi:rod shape-determining protein MreD